MELDDTERAEFIGAIVQLTRAIEQILKLVRAPQPWSRTIRGVL